MVKKMRIIICILYNSIPNHSQYWQPNAPTLMTHNCRIGTKLLIINYNPETRKHEWTHKLISGKRISRFCTITKTNYTFFYQKVRSSGKKNQFFRTAFQQDHSPRQINETMNYSGRILRPTGTTQRYLVRSDCLDSRVNHL